MSSLSEPVRDDDALTVGQKIALAILAISAGGLCIAVLGLLLDHDTLYHAGLVMAAPLYLIVLPICILLVGIMAVLAPVSVIAWLFSFGSGNRPDDDAAPSPAHDAKK
jgi:F0F1-type ATP synthase assembly protein I